MVLLRAQEPSQKQKKYFGNAAFRPFAVVKNVSTEQDIGDWLERAIAARLEGRRVQGGRLMSVPDESSLLEYAALDGARISGRWHPLEA